MYGNCEWRRNLRLDNEIVDQKNKYLSLVTTIIKFLRNVMPLEMKILPIRSLKIDFNINCNEDNHKFGRMKIN